MAALALQQAAATDPADNVVGQLTMLDSPEDNQADLSDLNPVKIDGANFDWFYLSQLKIARNFFVDGYVSYFGSPFNNFLVNDPDQGINNQALSNVVDVALNPL